jgi:hypothetical protein
MTAPPRARFRRCCFGLIDRGGADRSTNGHRLPYACRCDRSRLAPGAIFWPDVLLIDTRLRSLPLHGPLGLYTLGLERIHNSH